MEIDLWYEVKEDGKIIGDFHDSNGMDELLEFIRDNCKGKNIRITTYLIISGYGSKNSQLEVNKVYLSNVKLQYED